MYAYKEVAIKFGEFQSKVIDSYTVSRDNGLVFLAECKYGKSFAKTSSDALSGAMKLIDDAVR